MRFRDCSNDDSDQYDDPYGHRLVDDSDEDVNHKIPFLNCDKRSKYSGLRVIYSANPKFDRLANYR